MLYPSRCHTRQRDFYLTDFPCQFVGPLAERGVQLSREQIYRLVTQTPQRLNVDVFAALCDILDCGPQDLLEVVVERKQTRKSVAGGRPAVRDIKPVQARIRRPEDPGA